MPRNFDGSNDVITTSIGGLSGEGYGSKLALVYLETTGSSRCVVETWTSGGSLVIEFYVDSSQRLAIWTGGSANSTTSISSGKWWLVGMTKATGTSAVRFHGKNLTDDGAWFHENGSSRANWSTSAANINIGRVNDGSEGFDGDIAFVAQWNNVVLTDAQIESVTSLLAVANLAPSTFHVLDQDAVGVAVSDWTGSGAQQSAITDTVVSTRSSPLSYGLSVVTSDEGGVAEVTGTVAATLDAFTSTAAGSSVTGTSAQTLDAFTSTAAGSTVTGTSAQTLADFTSDASGTHSISGTSAQTLADFTSTASGSTVTGTSTQTLDAFTSSASGTHSISGTSAQTLDAFTSSATGTFGDDITGTVAATLDAFTSTASGSTVTGTSATTLDAFTASAAGSTVTGTSAQTLDAFTSTAAGTHSISGTSAQTLDAFTSSATGQFGNDVTGTVAATLAAFTAAAGGSSTAGTVAATLDALVAAATGSTVTGTSGQTLAAFVAAASGSFGSSEVVVHDLEVATAVYAARPAAAVYTAGDDTAVYGITTAGRVSE